MIKFTTLIKQFGKQGEKTGWTYIDITAAIASQLKPGNRLGFRVKGRFDDYPFEGLALLPMGDGNFILALNATIRKKIRKQKGAMLEVQLQVDTTPFQMNRDFLESLEYEPAAKKFFDTLPKSHQHYFSKWIDSAKTDPTKIKRISMAVNALMKGWGYGEMLRAARSS
ncbi:MAG TPA: YdeI/OmpD-associated family protein [Flavitalea sp.]|nr:YdeI/OmpD-associated family protein [Flavitalea sp.]